MTAQHRFLQPIEENGKDVLLQTIFYLKSIRERQFEIDDVFEPTKVATNNNRIFSLNSIMYYVF